MKVYHFGFGRGCSGAATIGIAEAYLRGEWDTRT